MTRPSFFAAGGGSVVIWIAFAEHERIGHFARTHAGVRIFDDLEKLESVRLPRRA